MTIFRDIFADEQTIRAVVDSSAVLLLAAALIAVWLCRPRSEKQSPFRGGWV
jgi:hypothetical protein